MKKMSYELIIIISFSGVCVGEKPAWSAQAGNVAWQVDHEE